MPQPSCVDPGHDPPLSHLLSILGADRFGEMSKSVDGYKGNVGITDSRGLDGEGTIGKQV